MFAAAANPYDEIVTKATDENLASEDWDINLQICDKVNDDGATGARNAIGALQKRLAHRNPNVQIYALELANTLAQNCNKPLLEEISSRNWTGALSRLINDRATVQPVQRKALGYIKAWAKQFEDTGDPNLGIMGELYDQLREKNFVFDEPEPVPENAEEVRRRNEEAELARVIELSKQDKGGRYQPSAPNGGAGSSSSAGPAPSPSISTPAYASHVAPQLSHQPVYAPPVTVAPPQQEPELVLDLNTATRVRALYTFTSAEVGELNFERGDVIKVLDRGFKEWWRGASNGKIGIFPVTYVEAIPELTSRELQEEAQEEARVFASLGLVDQLLQTLKGIDPSRGDRLEDRPELEEMYQASVGLQGQINALIKKYSDQKAELEHMNTNFLRAMRQYDELRNPVAVAQPQYFPPQPQPQPDPYGYAHQQQQQSQPQYPQTGPHQPVQSFPQAVPTQSPGLSQYSPQQQLSQHPPHSQPQQPHEEVPGQFYYAQQGHSTSSLHHLPPGAPGYPSAVTPPRQNTEPGAAGIGAGADPAAEHAAAWEAYYRQQAEAQQQQQQQQQGSGAPSYPVQPYPPQQEQGYPASSQPYPPSQTQPLPQPHQYGGPIYPAANNDPRPATYAGHPNSADGIAGDMARMAVHGP